MKTTFSFLAKRIAVPLVALWLVTMALITGAVAQDFVHQLESHLHRAMMIGTVEEENPQYGMVTSLSGVTHGLGNVEPLFFFQLPQRPDSMGSDDWYWGKWELVYGFQAALAYYDSEGNCLVRSGDYLQFEYEKNDGTKGEGFIDLEKLRGGTELADMYFVSFPGMSDPAPFLMNRSVMLRGWWEGCEFHPVRIRVGSPLDVVYERADVPGKDLVTINTTECIGYHYIPGSSFYLEGTRFDDVRQVLSADRYYDQRGLCNTVLQDQVQFHRGEEVYIAKLVVQCNPLKYAALRLLPAYLVSAVLMGICLYGLLKGTRRNLVEPLQVITRSYENNRRELSKYAESPLLELQVLGSHFNEKQGALHDSLQEIQRLQAALDYSKDAEENRRKLVSNLAHELKTPLAVIRSYAEGLQAGIAPEKTDQYLTVIGEETQHMDALVLQMLELSRLEAGKVKLRRDKFSLTEVAEKLVQTLSLAAEAKDLDVEFALRREVSVTADRARIQQVISNLLSNAIQYTPVGGKIRIKIFTHAEHAYFRVENTCQPLAQEVLEKLWDSFYRGDDSRSGKGTGLGLAIVKSIVTLHRGTCRAQNTREGVEFEFCLPL